MIACNPEAIAEARTLQDEKAALEAHTRKRVAQVASAGQDSAAYQREAADLREHIAETEAAAGAAEVALNQERTTLRARNADLEQQLADALANNEELERKIASVPSDLDAFPAVCHDVRVKIFHCSGTPADLQSKAAKLQSNLGEVAAQLHRTKTSRTALEKAALALVNALHPGAPTEGVSLLAAVPSSSAADAASALASFLPFLRLNLSLAPTASLTEFKVALVDLLNNRAPASPTDSFAPIPAHLHATHLDDDAQLAARLLSNAEKQLVEAESEVTTWVTTMFAQREAAEEALWESLQAWDELADAVAEDRKNT
ncbi:hypothetical protein H9P43_009350 [Blastocladiella emersonii ATCC 22665]|nr:hypothetical protein H9P43_009350 [Blastocladiella emersonii ATCC 22665]